MSTTRVAEGRGAISSLIAAAIGWFEAIPYAVVALLIRLSIAGVFWQSGRTKLTGWTVNDSTIELFRSEYSLPLINPVVAAWLAAVAEHAFPLLLEFGLAIGIAAFCLLIMTLIIQIFVYPDAWPTHGAWAGCLLVLMTRGAGSLSFDRLVSGGR